MIFLALTDQGLVSTPIVAASFADAADQIVAMFSGGSSRGTGPVKVALLLPQLTGTVTPASGQTPASLTQTGDSATQQTIRDAAANALANNIAFLGVASPTNAQVVAQVKALTRQVDGLIRLLVGDFTGTS